MPEERYKTNWERPINEYFGGGLTFDSLVKIYVGPQKKQWMLPKDLLCDRFSFFKAAFKGGFKEAAEKEMWLEEDDPEAFGLLVDYLFLRDLHTRDCGHQHDASYPCPSGYSGCTGMDAQLKYCKLYVLADKLGNQALADIALTLTDQTNAHMQDPVSPEAAAYVYENTSDDSPLRKQLVQQAVKFFFATNTKDADLAASTAAMQNISCFHSDVLVEIRKHMSLNKNNSCFMISKLYGCHLHGSWGVEEWSSGAGDAVVFGWR